MLPPFATLEYLYLGTSDFARDCEYYEKVIGGERLWSFHAFGAKVAAFRLCQGPLFLLADHRPAPSCMPIFAVADLAQVADDLKARGWHSDGDLFEVPNGPCYRFMDPSGNAFAILENRQPDAMEKSFAAPDNHRAIR